MVAMVPHSSTVPELTARTGDVHWTVKDGVPRVSPQVSSRSRCRWGQVAALVVFGALCGWISSAARAADKGPWGIPNPLTGETTGRETPQAVQPGNSKDLSASKQAYEEGLRAYNLGKWEQAAESFARAYELSGDAALLFNVGQAQRFAGNAKTAIIAYKAFLREKPGAANRPLVETKIRELEAEPVTLRPPAPMAPADSKDDLVAPPALPPPPSEPPQTPAPVAGAEPAGSPALRLSPPSPETVPVATSIPIQESIPAPAAHARWWVWTSVAAVVVAGAVTAVVLSTGGTRRDLSCGPGVDKCTTGGF